MLTVVIPTFNPDPGRLQRTLAGLRSQSLAASDWETVLIDNASTPALTAADWTVHGPAALRVVREPTPGLSHARRRGLSEARGEIIVLVDDDNVLASDYLEKVVRIFTEHPRLGAAGGRSLPAFTHVPEPWLREFDGLLACRDLGAKPLISAGLRNPRSGRKEYPSFAPIGAGMALQKSAIQAWMKEINPHGPTDRQGGSLSSGGDNDIILHVMNQGWEVGYFPELTLAHLIPPSRLEPEYLARLNRGIQKSWMQVLSLHDANPWPPLSPAGARLRQFKAWFTHQPWRSPAARIRWQGACGHFEGRVPA